MSVVNSWLMYASSTWSERATKYAICRSFIRSQRLAALRVTRAYRIVSAEELYSSRELHRAIYSLWNVKEFTAKWMIQIEWALRMRSEKRGATSCLLPGPLGGGTALAGHGCFRDYLHRRNRAPDAACLKLSAPDGDCWTYHFLLSPLGTDAAGSERVHRQPKHHSKRRTGPVVWSHRRSDLHER